MMWRNSEFDSRRRDAKRESDPISDLDSSLERELKEEVGLTAWPNQMRHAKTIRYQNQYKRETVYLFELNRKKPVSVNIDNREVVWAGFLSPEEALAFNLAIPVREYLMNHLQSPAKNGYFFRY